MKFLALSDFEDEVLAKIQEAESQESLRHRVGEHKTLPALQRAREIQFRVRQELLCHLKSKGIPGNATKRFWAYEAFIVDFVAQHYRAFGMPSPPT
jgi:hypothetical protein